MLSKIGQRKQTQVLFIARIFLQQFFQGKADIQRQVTQIVSHQHKLQVCSLDGNSKHNWTNKTDAASIHRPYFPPTDFSRRGCHAETNHSNRFSPTQASSMFIRW